MFGKCYNVRVPMLHRCGFPGCETFTLSTYCIEHELHVRAETEGERARLDADERGPGELVDLPQAAA